MGTRFGFWFRSVTATFRVSLPPVSVAGSFLGSVGCVPVFFRVAERALARCFSSRGRDPRLYLRGDRAPPAAAAPGGAARSWPGPVPAGPALSRGAVPRRGGRGRCRARPAPAPAPPPPPPGRAMAEGVGAQPQFGRPAPPPQTGWERLSELWQRE